MNRPLRRIRTLAALIPAWSLLLVPLVVLLVLPIIRGHIWYHEDLEFYFYGLRGQLRDFWLQGRLFGWNPLVSCGMPLLADIQLAAFYPLNSFFYLMPPGPAFNLYFLSHFCLGSYLAWRFLRNLGCSAWPSAAGTLVYLWSGFFWAHLHHATFIAAGIWLPGMLYAWDRMAASHRPLWKTWPNLALMVTMAALAGGSPQLFYYELITLGAYALVTVRIEGHSTKPAAMILGVGLAAVLIGIGCAAIELWPFYLASLEKYDQVLPPLEYSSSFALSPFALARLLVPNVFGNDFYPYAGQGYQGMSTYWESWCYLGVLTLPLVLLGMGRRGRRGFFSWLFGLTFVASLGTLGGLHILLATVVPLYDRFRAPSRWFMVVGLAASVLVAMVLEAYRRSVSRPDAKATASRPDAEATASQPDAEATASRPDAEATPCAFPEGPTPAQLTSRLPLVARITLVLGLELWAICALIIFLRETPLHPVVLVGWIVSLVLLLLAWHTLRTAHRGLAREDSPAPGMARWATLLLLLDFMTVLWTYNHSVKPEAATRVPDLVAAALEGLGHERMLADRSAPPYLLNAGNEFGYRGVRGYNPLNPRRLVRFLEASDRRGPSEGGISARVDRPTAPILNLLAGKFLATGKSRRQDGLLEVYRDSKRRLLLYQNIETLPRVFLTGAVRMVPDLETLWVATRAAVRLRPPPLVLEGPADGFPELDPEAVAQSSVTWLYDGRDEVMLDVFAAGPLALVLADTYARGWSATVDDRPVPIYPAYHALRAVGIDSAGHHRVAFVYRTPGLIPAAWVSGIALEILLVGLLIMGCAKRQPSKSD